MFVCANRKYIYIIIYIKKHLKEFKDFNLKITIVCAQFHSRNIEDIFLINETPFFLFDLLLFYQFMVANIDSRRRC